MNWRKIKQEEFDKLPQLDRIELRQKRDYINENRLDFDPFGFLKHIFMAPGFVFLLAIILINNNLDASVRFLSLFVTILKIGIYGFIILFIFQLISYIKHRDFMNEMYSQYFDQKTEVKKKK